VDAPAARHGADGATPQEESSASPAEGGGANSLDSVGEILGMLQEMRDDEQGESGGCHDDEADVDVTAELVGSLPLMHVSEDAAPTTAEGTGADSRPAAPTARAAGAPSPSSGRGGGGGSLAMSPWLSSLDDADIGGDDGGGGGVGVSCTMSLSPPVASSLYFLPPRQSASRQPHGDPAAAAARSPRAVGSLDVATRLALDDEVLGASFDFDAVGNELLTSLKD
jgi:hypothetical protein